MLVANSGPSDPFSVFGNSPLDPSALNYEVWLLIVPLSLFIFPDFWSRV